MAEQLGGYNFKPQTSSGVFLSLKQKGDTIKIRLVSTPVHYQREWEGKSRERFAWLVLDRNAEKPEDMVRVFSAGVSIYLIIKGLNDSEDWGDPAKYDLTITRTEESTANYYKVIPSPKHSSLTEGELKLIKESKIDLLKIVEGKGTKTFGEPGKITEEPPVPEEE